MSYADDIAMARGTLPEIAGQDPRVLPEPAPVVDVMELGESGIRLVLRVYAGPEECWNVLPALNERIKTEFDRRGLTIPFPQMDIHLDGSVPQA
jgi:small conductance mechanosensitive channel